MIQLSVPIIAIAAGAILLGETVTVAVIIAAVFVLGGIALTVTAPKAPTDHT